MMNIRNFHLKSNLISLNSQEFNLNFSKEIVKKQKLKLEKTIYKSSEQAQMLINNFKQASKLCQNCDQIKIKPKKPIIMFDFDPPIIEENKKGLKNRSCTLSPKKLSERAVMQYHSHKLSSKANQNHKRRFSDDVYIKQKSPKRANNHSKTKPDTETESLVNPESFKIYNDRKLSSEQSKDKINMFSKINTKVKVFQMDDLFNWNQEEKIIHSGKNGSLFITTLPSKRKNFRSTKSTSLKERKSDQNVSFSKEKQTQKNTQNQSQTKPQITQKYEDISRSIHTAASGTARRIDYDKICYSPVSPGFFPQSSIWNRHEEFVRNAQIKPRSYKIIDKSSSTLKSKQKDNPCRPWSPSKPDLMIQNLDQEEVFPQIEQQ